MLQKLKKRNQGFTIIEVLIVLAIAGLILLIVFLAVPALQRNSRNTQIKNAAASILGAVSEFEDNNQGAAPTGVDVSGGTVTLTGASGTSSSSAKIQSGYTVDMGSSMPSDTGALVINVGHKCNGNDFSSDSTNRAVSVGYRIEGGSSTSTQCAES